MKINEKVLNLPPYISTSWKNISCIFSNEENQLEIHLHSGSIVKIPMIDPKIIDLIFYYHLQFLEKPESKPQPHTAKAASVMEKDNFSLPFSFPLPLQSDNILSFGQMLQHNPQQSDMPNIPKEILEKVSFFAQSMSAETGQVLFPDIQPHCNCLYCQIGKAVNQQQEPTSYKVDEEIVSDEDLRFKEWDISKTAGDLYEVKNPLDANEHYQVFLGTPIGCTCGKTDCDHIKAVLNTEI